jgi:hypothetical protein
MTRYAIERLLYRLSLSPHRERFVLKGAMLFAVWASAPYRSTADLDLLGCGDPDPQVLATAIREVCSVATDDDGVTFLADTLRAGPAREEQAYQGARLTMTAVIAGARLAIHVDVGHGDAITPGAQELEYPSLLDMPRAKLLAYPPETVVAEKLHALVADDSAKRAQWRGFLRRTEFAVQPRPFPDVIAAVADFVLAPAMAAAAGSDFGLRWELGGPWKR